jgi:hypothetical protein
MLKLRLALFFALAAVSMRAAVVFQTLDTFNRPNATTLGSSWIQQVGTDQILNNQATALTNLSLATYNGLSSNNAAVSVFDNGTGTQYIALVLDYADANDNFFVKVQNNGGSAGFDTYGFYYGNNGSNNATGGSFFGSLTSTFTSGEIWVTVSGLTATLNIDPTFTGIAQQTYSFTYLANPGATGVGMGFFTTAGATNFGILAAPEPGTFWLLGSVLTGAFLLTGSRRLLLKTRK